MTVNDLIINNLQEQRHTGSYCDIRLIVGKHHTWVHSSVVCPFSKFISDYYDAHKPKKPSKKPPSSFMKITLTGKVDTDCFECLKSLAEFMYGTQTSIEKQHIAHVISYCRVLKLSKALSKIINCTVEGLEIDDILEHSDFIKDEPFNDFEENCKLSELSDLDIKQNSSESSNESANDTSDEDFEEYFKSQKNNSKTKFSPGKKQKCIGCKFRCFKTLDLVAHLQKTGHGGNVCSLCSTKLNSPDQLKEHFALHDHPKPYFCTFCDSRFQSRSLLNQHQPTHVDEKPFTCPHCQRGFKRKVGLTCHLVTHSAERKHLCDECGFSTTYARVLRDHKLIHTGNVFKCSFPGCTRTATRKDNMRQHYATHTKERPYVCELCGHKFTASKSLKRHAVIHTRDSNNMCPHCPYKARRNDNLKAHILRQHSEKYPKIEIGRLSESIMIEPDVGNIFESPKSS